MGNFLNQQKRPQELSEFRKLHNSSASDIEIPVPASSRRFTDKKYLITLGVFTFLLVPFLIYSLIHADIRRLNGYDNCGNLCGVKNSYDQFPCSGKDFSNEPYLVIDQDNKWPANFQFQGIPQENITGSWLDKRHCASSCPAGYVEFFKLCIQTSNSAKADNEEFMKMILQIKDDINTAWWGILLSAIVSLGVTILFMVFFRYFVAFVVWFILLGSVSMFIIVAAVFWGLYFKADDDVESKEKQNAKTAFVTLAIVFTIISFILLILVTCMFKRIKLIIQLFKEAAKAVFAMPSIMLVPLLGSVTHIIVTSIFLTLMVALSTAGILTEIIKEFYDYMPNVGMQITIGFCIFMYIWYAQFAVGCQYMIVAGGISSWFFSSNKPFLRSPILTATAILFRFHLGTVAIGSLVITLMTIIRELIRSIARGSKLKFLIECCIQNIEEFVKFLSKNAYIQTAMHGEPFFKSGRRAAKLLVNNAVNVIALNSLGDFVLGMAAALVVIVCSALGVFICAKTGVQYFWAPSIIAILVAALIVGSFFNIFETAIDTIFICFCEDTLLNDGIARPYAMSKGLMQFIEDSKAVFKPKQVQAASM